MDTTVCPRCNGQLEAVPVKTEYRPHLKCKGCGRVFVPHETCKDKTLQGLHPCVYVQEHLA